VTTRLPRTSEISRIIRDQFEAAANIRFSGFLESSGTFPQCSAPQLGMCGTNPCNQYSEDIRIAIPCTTDGSVPVTRMIPASETNCTDRGQPASWGAPPWNIDLAGNRACRYNVFIGDDPDTTCPPAAAPWRNHVLHEVGHALGLVHEFLQADYFDFRGPNGAICANSQTQPDGAVNPANYASLTFADSASVMMYQEVSCGIDGNYSNEGLSALDRTSLHILYPESDRVAEYTGTTVVRTGETVRLRSVLELRGARVGQAVTNLLWYIGDQIGTASIFEASWDTPGVRTGTFTYQDFLGRNFATGVEVRVLTAEDFSATMGAIAAAQGSLQ
jgi:hypothetical protein